MFKLSSNRLPHQGKFVRWGILGLSSAPIFGTYVYNQGYRISFLQCPILHLTGVPCPSCGMTRAFMAIVRGDLHQAIEYHLFSPVLFVGFVIAVIHVTFELLTQRRLTTFYIECLKLKKVQLSIVLIFFTYYILRLYWWQQTGDIFFRV
ncbi:MAG: DUF2752 domain-containing protein [Calothrix sp. C42_A2020_038]|nr:DUF2752 domain-containing protein [Calothrix sp. C42_A2020_038]